MARIGTCIKRAACALLLFSAASTPLAQPAGDEVTFNIVNSDIESVTKLVSQMTGRNFLLDPRVKGTINIISSRPVPRAQVYSVFLSALRLQGYTVVEGADAIKIVPEADAKQNAGPTAERAGRTAGDRIVTAVYPMLHESAVQLMGVLRPLIPPNNAISVLPGSNTLIITDYADNIRRLSRIIQAVDLPDAGEVVLLTLKHASALDIAQVIARLVPDGSGPSVAGALPRFVIAPDVRSNSLLVRANSPGQIARVRSLVASLDVPARGPGTIHVVYLRNADATKLAETLRAIAGSEAKPTLAPTAPGQLAPPASSAAGASFIQADAATNSLIIAAPDNLYNSLRGVIDQLDSRRAQVYLEALIAEVSTNKAAEFGIQFQSLSGAGSGVNDTRVIGGTNFSTTPGTNILGAAANIAAVGTGFNIGVIRGRITLPGVGEILNLGVLARALETQADANILSTPNLLTMDNEEAKIVVGQNVPFITGSFAQATAGGVGGGVNPFQTIERRDVGLTLRVRPQIAEGRTVKLRIYQEVSSIQDTSNAAGIITNKRSIESTVLVEDNEIVVLGGLVQDDVRNSADKVPLLGDIPFLGTLFRFDARRRSKTNLMVFIRPVVLREAEAATSLTRDRYEYIRNEQGTPVVPAHLLLPEFPAPQLPPLAPLLESPVDKTPSGYMPQEFSLKIAPLDGGRVDRASPSRDKAP